MNEIDPVKMIKLSAYDFSAPSQTKEISAAGQMQQTNATQAKEQTQKSTQQQQIYDKDMLLKNGQMPTLNMSKKEYTTLMKTRPLIKYRPIRNSMIKKGDKAFLAEGLGVKTSDTDKIINETLKYLVYGSVNSIYYDPYQSITDDMYKEDLMKKNLLEKSMLNEAEKNKEKENYYKERAELMEPYVFRHGTKTQVVDYVKYKLSDVKGVMKNLYNLLDNETSGLFNYYKRPCHILDNRTLLRLHETMKFGTDRAEQEGLITTDINTSTVDWALRQLYKIQSDTRLKPAIKFLYNAT